MSTLHLDGGHGGLDNGASANGIKEKDWNLEASLYQQKRFKELGVDVSMTRTTDINYESVERTNIVKRSGAKICISNHFNAGGGEGVETIHSIFSNGKLAKMIADEIVKVGQPLRRVFSRKHNSSDYYYMHRLTGSVETVIVEYGFLDNSRDFKRMNNKSYRLKMYEAVVKAVCGYINVKYVTEKEVKNETFYRVITGSFNDKSNADKRVAELKKKGFDSFIELK